MKNAGWKDIAEMIGMSAIVASLLFVGYQLKQDRDIAIAEAFQARAFASAEHLRASAANTYAIRANVRDGLDIDPDQPFRPGQVPEEFSEFPPIELYAAVTNNIAMLYIWDNSHFQYTQGFLPEDHWQRVRETIKEELRTKSMVRFAISLSDVQLRADFRAELDEISRELGDGVSRN